MKVLFICNQNLHRSKTAEEVFHDRFETRSAGLYNEVPVSRQEIAWADLVVVMEDVQRAELGRRFPQEYLKKRIVTLDIPDRYAYQQPALVRLLKRQMQVLVEPLVEDA